MRAIRETWGADSGTNVIRRETFYRDEMRQKTWLRVHVIPPLDGIYAQWDFNAGARRHASTTRATRAACRSTARTTRSFGNLDDPCNADYDDNDTERRSTRATASALPAAHAVRPASVCQTAASYHRVDRRDRPDVRRRQRLARLERGHRARTARSSTATRSTRSTDLTPGGAAQSVVAVPYYRDDSCFDDGTGQRPGPALHPRSDQEPRVAAPTARRAVLEARARRRPRRRRPTSSRATSPPTACTSCSSPTPTTRARPCRSTRSSPSSAW